jgi:hypothetical protein
MIKKFPIDPASVELDPGCYTHFILGELRKKGHPADGVSRAKVEVENLR